jgi:hypothetical protein
MWVVTIFVCALSTPHDQCSAATSYAVTRAGAVSAMQCETATDALLPNITVASRRLPLRLRILERAMTLYHFTDSARLPWILRDQALKPGSNNIGDFPDDFLWATPDLMGDPTASSAVNPSKYCDGDIAAVRFMLSAADFAPWDEMKASHPRWEPRHIAILESAAVRMGATPRQIAQWQCRTEPRCPRANGWRWSFVHGATRAGGRCNPTLCVLSAPAWACCSTA